MNEGEDWVYSERVKEHFLNPRNFLMGDEKNFDFDAVGTVGNPICGDQMRMYLRIAERKNNRGEKEAYIADLRWKTYGCASAIASTSALSEIAKGKSLDDALKITAQDIDDFLGNLPKHKFHCSVLGQEALKEAIKNYNDYGIMER